MHQVADKERASIIGVLVGALCVMPATIIPAIYFYLKDGSIGVDYNFGATNILFISAIGTFVALVIGAFYALPMLILFGKFKYDNFLGVVVVAITPSLIVFVTKMGIDFALLVGYYSLSVALPFFCIRQLIVLRSNKRMQPDRQTATRFVDR